MSHLASDSVGNSTGGNEQDLGPLLSALSSKDGLTRQRARQALTDVGAPAVPGLVSALGSSDSNERWEAAKALNEIRDPSAAPALVKALEDPRFGVRWLTAEGLIGIGPAAIKPLLKALLDRSGSVLLREGAHHVLKAIYKESPSEQLHEVLDALEGPEPSNETPIAAERALESLSAP